MKISRRQLAKGLKDAFQQCVWSNPVNTKMDNGTEENFFLPLNTSKHSYHEEYIAVAPYLWRGVQRKGNKASLDFVLTPSKTSVHLPLSCLIKHPLSIGI